MLDSHAYGLYFTLREPFQFGNASYDLYWTFEQLLDEPSVWFGFLLLSAVSLMPDMALMTISRYFYRTKTQLAQVSYSSSYMLYYIYTAKRYQEAAFHGLQHFVDDKAVARC